MEIPQKPFQPFSPGMLVALFFVLTACGLVLGSLISFSLVASVMHIGFSEVGNFILNPNNVAVAQFANGLASIIGFGIPAYVIAKLQGGTAWQRWGLDIPLQRQLILLVIALSVVGLFLSGALGDLSEKLPINNAWKQWADHLENQYKNAMLAMTHMDGIGDLLFTLLAVAVIPAIVEELFFRASLQSLLSNWFKNDWVGILTTAIIFSAFHFSFYGFLSRMSLGIILGLLYYYSKSIWLPIIMHLINNAIGVTTIYFVRNDIKKVDEVMNGNLPYQWLLLALVVCVYLLILIKRFTTNERLDQSI